MLSLWLAEEQQGGGPLKISFCGMLVISCVVSSSFLGSWREGFLVSQDAEGRIDRHVRKLPLVSFSKPGGF